MRFFSVHLVVAILTLFWSVESIAQQGLASGEQPHAEKGIAPDQCRIDLTLPEHAKVTIDDHDYGERRSITLPAPKPPSGTGGFGSSGGGFGRSWFSMTIDFPNGGRRSGPVEVKGGAVTRINLPSPPIEAVFLEGPSDEITSLAFSADGKRIAMGTDAGQTILWDAGTGYLRWNGVTPRSNAAEDAVSVAFSPDGRQLLVGLEHAGLCVLDAATGDQVREIVRKSDRTEEESVPAKAVTFSPDGRLLVAALSWCMLEVGIWDAKNGKLLRTLRGPKPRADNYAHEFNSVAISRDGRHIIAGSSDGMAILWDVSTGKVLRQFQVNSDHSIESVAISPDGSKLLAGADDSKAFLWSIDSGKQLQAFHCATQEYGGAVYSVTFSPDGRKTLAGTDEGAFLFDIVTGTTIRVFRTSDKFSHTNAVAFAPDGRHVASLTGDLDAALWETATGKRVQVFRRPKDIVRSLAFDTDGKRLTVGYGNQRATVWDMGTGRPVDEVRRVKPDEDEDETSPDEYTSADGRWMISRVKGNTVVLTDTRTAKKITILDYPLYTPIRAAFSPKTLRVAVADEDSVHIFNPETKKELATLVRAYGGRDWLVTTPGGNFAGTPGGRTLIRWRVGEAEYPLERFEKQLYRPDIVAQALQGRPDLR